MTSPPALLSVTGLALTLGGARLLDGVDLAAGRGEVVGLVGESGSGKTLTGLSVLGLAPAGSRLEGRIDYDGTELVAGGQEAARRLRGSQISMIFQEPRSSLNPALPVGRQITDVMRAHLPVSRRAAATGALDLLGRVGLPDPRGCFAAYPHELSGGMCQRAMIAMALSCGPRLLIADEPTTALDVTVQAQIVSLLRSIADEQDLAILLITHNLAVVTEICDRVVTMYCGQVVAADTTRRVVTAPAHPYTWALISAARPALPGEPAPPGMGTLPAKSTPPGNNALSAPAVPPGEALAPVLAGVPGAGLAGEPANPADPPAGCRFHPRCPFALPVCSATCPGLADAAGGGQVRCLRHAELSLDGISA
jgi:peptide/nickel transport system ATP-binding protein